MVERRDGCLPTAAEGFAPADDAAVGRDAHHERIDRGARAPRKQRRRRPMVHGDAKRESLDPFDGDRRHVASTRAALGYVRVKWNQSERRTRSEILNLV